MSEFFDTPILFILYNRLEVAKQVFEQIRKIKPQKLYAACDGYKKEKPGDKEKVEAVRQWILQAVDWDCQLHTKFAEENQGCKYGPANAISWVFENEEEAIILEDDILADESFFWYCREMLERYRQDTRIMIISGHKAVWDFPIEEDYFFTAFSMIWGWATWKRAWKYFDIEMKNWPYYKEHHLFAHAFDRNVEISMTDNLDLVYTGRLDAWDYPWTLAIVSNSGLGILPKHNLIQNIGYGEDATHSIGNQPDWHKGTLDIPLSPVRNIVRNWEYDQVHAKKFVNPRKLHRFIRHFIPRPILKVWYRMRGVKVYYDEKLNV